MARFLISTMPAAGHVAPALALATELSARGHEVAWHTGAAYAGRVEATGAQFEPMVDAPDFERIPVEPDPGATGMAAGVSVMRRLFVDRVAGQVADYERILRTFPADAIIVDMCSFGADALHARGGPPYATIGINPLVTLDPEVPPFGTGRPPATTALGRLRNRFVHHMARTLFFPKVTGLLNDARVACGAPPLPPGVSFADAQRSPLLHLMPTTPLFEYPRANMPPEVRFVGPLLPAAAPFEPTSWWDDLDGRRVVHVTQGTYATAGSSLIRPALEALAGEDVLVVATTPDLASLGPIPTNARVAAFLPHAHLLPRVDVMVTNAGYNGVLAALAHGVPLVCAGRTEDKADVSGRVAWSGAGLDLRTDAPTATQVRNAVRRILRDPSFRAAARRIADDFARHDGPAEAAELLEVLARSDGHESKIDKAQAATR